MRCFTLPENELYCEGEAHILTRTSIPHSTEVFTECLCYSCLVQKNINDKKEGRVVLDLEVLR